MYARPLYLVFQIYLLITSEQKPELLRKALEAGVTEIFSKNSVEPIERYLSHYIEDNVY